MPVPGWLERFGVVAGITTRLAGSFDLAGSPVRPADFPTSDRWYQLQARLHFPAMVTARQVHGTRISEAGSASGWSVLEGFDGHVTAEPGVLLTVTVADCVPVYLLDPNRGVIGLLHAGWRGTAAGVLRAGLEKLLEVSDSRPSDLVIHLGVGICGQCYEVGPEVRAQFGFEPPSSQPARLDLPRILADQARELGVTDISASSWCSAHDPTVFFSHRASRGRDGRMVAYLGRPTQGAFSEGLARAD